MAFLMRSAKVSSTSSQETRSHSPPPRSPFRLSGKSTLSGSVIWLMVAGPLAQFLPRLPGWYGFPSNLRTWFVSLSIKAVKPQALSQLKQVVGII